jgi:hypothetical protein
MKVIKYIYILLLFLHILGLSQMNTIETGQAIIIDIYNENNNNYIILDFITNDKKLINNHYKSKTYQLNEGINIGGWVSDKKDIDDFVLNKHQYIHKGLIINYEIKNNTLHSIFFSLLYDTDK